MHSFKFAAAVALMVAPSSAFAQNDGAKIVLTQKSWLPANFRSFDCALVPGHAAAAISGGGAVSFGASGGGGVELTASSVNGGVPTITAFAINTKGTGANSGRMAQQSCPTAPAPSSSSAAACSVSGDVDSPIVRFTVPLTALGDTASAKNYAGTVTIVKLASGGAPIGTYLSKKGYDYYHLQNNKSVAGVHANPGLMVLAACDSSKLIAKGDKPMTATYDLVMGKK